MVRLIETNFQLHACTVPDKTPGMLVMKSENLTYVDCGLSCDTFNIIHVTNGAALRPAELSGALSHFQEQKRDRCLWVNKENRSEKLQELLKAFSMTQQNEEAGMVLDLEDFQAIESAGHPDISIVNDARALSDYAQVIAFNWEPPDRNILEYFRLTADHYLNKANGVRLLIYYHKGKPAGTLEMYPSDEQTVGFYGLATLKGFRGQGIGSALMTCGLNLSRLSGYRQVILQASDEGIAIYRRLGFREYTRYYEYT